MTAEELLRVPGGLLPELLREGLYVKVNEHHAGIRCGTIVREHLSGTFAGKWRVIGHHGVEGEGMFSAAVRPEHLSLGASARWETRAWLCRYLCAGVGQKMRCPKPADGLRTLNHLRGTVLSFAPGNDACTHCDHCGHPVEEHQDGYRIPPHDVRWQLDWPSGDLTATESAALLGASARWVAVEKRPVSGLLGLWTERTRGTPSPVPWRDWYRSLSPNHAEAPMLSRAITGIEPSHIVGWDWFWAGHRAHKCGTETGEEGMAAADAAALEDGYALRQKNGILVPTPDGVVLVEAP